MNLKTCLFRFPLLTTSFKILHWDSQSNKTKKKKKWGRTNLLEVKEGEEVHEVALEKWEEAAAWLIWNDRWIFISKIHKSLNSFFYFYSSSKTFNFLEIYNITMEIFISARYPFIGRNLVFTPVLPEWGSKSSLNLTREHGPHHFLQYLACTTQKKKKYIYKYIYIYIYILYNFV